MLRVALLLAGLVAGLLTCELALRVFGYQGAAERRSRAFDSSYAGVRPDSWIFRLHIEPGRAQTVQVGWQQVALPKPAGETRVLFLGDSATQGAFVQPAQAFPHKFQALLQKRDPGSAVRVINAGVWGMTTLDELHLFKQHLVHLQPDAVVLGLFMANDINFNLGHREYRRNEPASVLAALRRHSALVHFGFLQAMVINARLGLLRTEPGDDSWVPVELGLIDGSGLHLLNYPQGELATYLKPTPSLVRHAYGVLASALGDLSQITQREGIHLRVLLIPTASRVASRLRVVAHPYLLRELEGQGIRVREEQLDVDAPTREVLSICEELQLDCVDPTLQLRKLGTRAFFPYDEHPTVAGHAVLARALLRD